MPLTLQPEYVNIYISGIPFIYIYIILTEDSVSYPITYSFNRSIQNSNLENLQFLFDLFLNLFSEIFESAPLPPPSFKLIRKSNIFRIKALADTTIQLQLVHASEIPAVFVCILQLILAGTDNIFGYSDIWRCPYICIYILVQIQSRIKFKVWVEEKTNIYIYIYPNSNKKIPDNVS